MTFIALITFDLTDVNSSERQQFYQVLKLHGWIQLDHLTTAWKCRKQKSGRHSALLEIEEDLKYAKDISMLSRVDYAIQLSPDDLYQSYR